MEAARTKKASRTDAGAVQHPDEGADRQIAELTCLYEITSALSRNMDIRPALEEVLGILAARMGMVRGTIAIMKPDATELQVEVAHGLSPAERRRGRYRLGEGITGHVVASGEPIVVPRVSDEPRFLNRTRSRGEIADCDASFICVPINAGGKIIGALSVDKPCTGQVSFDGDLRLLTIISGIIAQTVGKLQAFQAERENLLHENKALRLALTEKYAIDNFIGRSGRILDVLDMVVRVAGSNATVLLRGESGTGKSLVAKAIHYNSQRRDGPFITVNCSALPEALIESELFGHERGAFTGASSRKEGRFELAMGGTIFLDEIGELPQAVQVKLLHVIQEREFQHLGGTRSIRADVRIIAATNRDLEEALKHGQFREDLYYRLNVFPIYLPPLRERKTDITLLAAHFLERFSRENGREIRGFESAAIDRFMAYHWPGNVRELQNAVERAVLVCDGDVMRAHHLPPHIQAPQTGEGPAHARSLAGAVERLERELIEEALEEAGGSQTKAAGILGASLRVVHYKIAKYGIDASIYKRTSARTVRRAGS